jgi:hypothetical protein
LIVVGNPQLLVSKVLADVVDSETRVIHGRLKDPKVTHIDREWIQASEGEGCQEESLDDGCPSLGYYLVIEMCPVSKIFLGPGIN